MRRSDLPNKDSQNSAPASSCCILNFTDQWTFENIHLSGENSRKSIRY